MSAIGMCDNRQIAHQFYHHSMKKVLSSSPSRTKSLVRRLARTDLFYLLCYLLNRPDVDNDWLYERCVEVQNNPNGYLDLWAREHYKSTIITFGKTIQDILCDPENTFCILSFNRPIAKSFLRQIKREFEGNSLLKRTFDDILYDNPQRQSPKWSEDDGIIVKRSSNPKEATIEAWGLVDSQPTSKHFGTLVYEDVVTKDGVSSPDMIAKLTEAWELSRSIGTKGGVSRYIGTRYHYVDTYQTIIDRKAAIPRIYPATEDGTEFGEPVFWTREKLEERRKEMGSYTFACQMLQNPLPESRQVFKQSWLRYWPAKNFNGLNTYIFVDPANSKVKNSDYTAIFVVGLGADQNYYVMTMLRDKINLTERVNTLFSLVREYRPLYVYYEQYGMQADIQHIQFRQEKENYRFEVYPLGGSASKKDRISRLEALFENGRIYLPETCIRVDEKGTAVDLTKVFVNDEYLSYPYVAHDDMLDCLSRIADPKIYLAFPESTSMNGITVIQQHFNDNPFYFVDDINKNTDVLSIRAERRRL